MTHSLLLNTSRLTIVGINEINTDQLLSYFLNNFEHLKQGGGSVPNDKSSVLGVMEAWFDNINNDNEVRFFLILEEEIIGIVGISNIVRGSFHAAYLGYNMAENFQGKGYMTEALKEIIDFAFQALNLHRLMANYRPANIASGRILEKLSFDREGYAEKYLLVDGQWQDHILTSRRNENWVQ